MLNLKFAHYLKILNLGGIAAKYAGVTIMAMCWLLAQGAVTAGTPLANIHIRDPFILPVEQDRGYYLVASSAHSVTVRQSEDLADWGEPKTVFVMPENFWGNDAVWAPEIHLYRGRYYLFATFMNQEPLGEQWTNWPARIHRGTQILTADSPLGPFQPFANRAHTPTNEMALDGTLWVEQERPYMVYCQEWVQVCDGGMKLIQLSEDLSAAKGEPQLLFKGSDAPWAPKGRNRYITDGPALYRSKSGKLFMLWSGFSNSGYTTGLAISDSGKVSGPWRQQPEPFYREDGGHAMIFRRFDGALMVALHRPNRSPEERCRLIEVADTGETLRWGDNSKAKAVTLAESYEKQEQVPLPPDAHHGSVARLSVAEVAALRAERNCWFQPSGAVLHWGQQTVSADEFAAFMRSRGFDRSSRFADPKFVDGAGHNYWLAPDSPARALDGQGQSAGALPETIAVSKALELQGTPDNRSSKPSFPRLMGGEKEYLSAVLPQELIQYSGIEVPSDANIHVLSEGAERYLEFRLVPGQPKKNNGIRAEISVDYPYHIGDIVRYQWEMRLPEGFQADDPRNRWWVMGQWHDQPDRTKGESWQGFPAHSPPVSFNYVRRDGKDFLSLLVGSPKMKSVGLLPLTRGNWHVLDVVIKWSPGDEGRVAVFLDGSQAPTVTGTGPNMHNGFQHYLKLGMYRHPDIATENRLDIRNVRIEKLKDWPEVEPR